MAMGLSYYFSYFRERAPPLDGLLRHPRGVTRDTCGIPQRESFHLRDLPSHLVPVRLHGALVLLHIQHSYLPYRVASLSAQYSLSYCSVWTSPNREGKLH